MGAGRKRIAEPEHRLLLGVAGGGGRGRTGLLVLPTGPIEKMRVKVASVTLMSA